MRSSLATGIGEMKRRQLWLVVALAVSWTTGCHGNRPANENKQRWIEMEPRVEASQYPDTPISDRVITLRITEGGRTLEATQLEGRMIRIEKGQRPIWSHGSSEEWTVGLVCSITGPTTAKVTLFNIKAAMGPAGPLFSESAEPIGSYDLSLGPSTAVGTGPTLDVTLVALVKKAADAPGVGAVNPHQCCIGCSGLGVCAIKVVLENCGSCGTE
jgi:hypothetical protein